MANKVTRFALKIFCDAKELHRAGCQDLKRNRRMGEEIVTYREGYTGIEIMQEFFDEIRWMDGHPAWNPNNDNVVIMPCCKMNEAEKGEVFDAPVADDFNPSSFWDKSVFDFDSLTDAEKSEWRNNPYIDPRTGDPIPEDC